MDGPGTLGARVAREYRECKDDDFGNIGARGGFTQRRQVRKGGNWCSSVLTRRQKGKKFRGRHELLVR